MKRGFPQKVKPVSCTPLIGDPSLDQAKHSLAGANRRTRTSAAMIGLALSMGASSLLLPRQDDGAVAAEPISTESTTAVVPLALEVAALPTTTEVESPTASPASSIVTIEHVVQDGQTLWQLSRRYNVSVDSIVAVNGIATDTTLRPGQVIKVPVPSRVVETVRTANVPATVQSSTPKSVSLPAPVSSREVTRLTAVDDLNTIQSADATLEAERNEALNRLRQERDKLRSSLAELRSEESVVVPGVTSKDDPAVSQSGVEDSRRLAMAQDLSEQNSLPHNVEADTVDQSTAYQVKPGDTLSQIAQAHQVSQQELVAVNGLINPDRLQVNQPLTIPQVSLPVTDLTPSVSSPLPSVTPQPTVVQPEVETVPSLLLHRVNPGETIAEIARDYDTSRASLIGANQLSNPNVILVGQLLQIPVQPSEGVDATGSFNSESNVPSAVVSVVPPTTQFEPEASYVASLPDIPQGLQSSGGDSSSESVLETLPPVLDDSALVPSLSPVTLVPVESTASESSTSFNQELSVAPWSTTPARPAETPQPSSANPYVDRLMAEIYTLRDQYVADHIGVVSSQESAVVAATTIPPLSAPESVDLTRVNPEFNPQGYLESTGGQISTLPGQADQLRVEVSSSVLPGSGSTSVTAPTPELVAVAPLGSESYEPLLQSITGQMVSPELPPLSDAEAYLPDSIGFDGYIWPARGTLTSGYGWRWGRMHRGIDIGAPTGTPVYAAADGVVEYSGWNSGGYGNMVEIRHADGSMTRYAHHSRNIVRVGQRVSQGEQIAEVGSTGYSTGPHLHFEVHLPDQGTVNPIAYLP